MGENMKLNWPEEGDRAFSRGDDPMDDSSALVSARPGADAVGFRRASLVFRFASGPHRRRMWPKPDLVTVATSPDFLDKGLRRQLMRRIAVANPTVYLECTGETKRLED